MSTASASEACSFFLARLDAEVRRLRGVTFPGHHVGPRLWLNLVSGVIDTAAGYLQQAAIQGASTAQASKLVRDAEKLGGTAYLLLRHVAGTDATDIPHQTVAPFQRWVDAVGIESTIFFRAEHLPNYELGTFSLRGFATVNSPSESLVKALGELKEPVLRITVPGQAMGMLPHFAVVGHELGHAIQDRIKLNLVAHEGDAQGFEQRFASRMRQVGRKMGSDEQIRVREIYVRWVNEIKADAVGHILGGPSFFFALCGFLELAGRSYGVSPTHPPSHLRRDLLMNQLAADKPSFIEVFKASTGREITPDINSPNVPPCPASDQLFAELSPEFGELDAAICVELIPFVDAIAPRIFQAARAHIASEAQELQYTPERLQFDLDTHLENLCALIPPIEYRNSLGKICATELASILNIGWAALLTRLDRFPGGSNPQMADSARKLDRMHELLLKAVELSEARKLWNEHR